MFFIFKKFFKKTLDKQLKVCYNKDIVKERKLIL